MSFDSLVKLVVTVAVLEMMVTVKKRLADPLSARGSLHAGWVRSRALIEGRGEELY